jgi:hypothetical protein
MAFNINEIKSQLTGGGARQSLFQVQFNNPANGTGNIKVPFMVRTAQLPESKLGNIAISYFGRKINLAGDRTFADWGVTVINDEDFLIRNAMEEWSNKINSLEGNLRSFGSASPLLYKSNAKVTQFSKTGIPIREYTFYGIYPSDIQAIDLDWDATDRIEEFRVTFLYDYWEVTGGVTGRAGGS